MFIVDRWVHSNSLFNVQPEENGMSSYGNTIPRNCMIWYVEENKRKYPTVIPSHGILLSGMLRKTFRIDELQCCSDVEVLVCKAVENVQVLEAEKKIGVDWPRPSQFQKKFFKESNDKIEKSAWIGLDKVKKASSAASVF